MGSSLAELPQQRVRAVDHRFAVVDTRRVHTLGNVGNLEQLVQPDVWVLPFLPALPREETLLHQVLFRDGELLDARRLVSTRPG